MSFGRAGHLGDQIIHATWGQALALCRWAPHSLNYISFFFLFIQCSYHLCGLALTNTTDNLSEDVPAITYRLLPVFVPLIIHNLARADYSHNGFHKLSWPRLKPASPRWETPHSNHASTPTCFSLLASLQLFFLLFHYSQYIYTVAMRCYIGI